jgi:glyoxylase-like metal-dependent hydrolase (beta-lactamase superfamily II)
VLAHDTMAVLSHTHLDHTGGAHEFTQVAVHVLEADDVAAPPPASLDTRTEMDLLGLAIPEGHQLPPSLLAALPDAGYDPSAFAIRPATVTRALVDGDVIDLGDRRLRVIHAPGHTRGSILLYDEELRWLYTGDVLNDSPVFDEMNGADIASYVESMRRMRDLDVTMVRPGHDNSFDGDHMRDLIDAYLTLRAPSGG